MTQPVPLLRRLVLLLIFAGIASLFAGSLLYRLNNPSLFKSASGRRGEQAQSPPGGQAMDAGIMERVSALMAKLKTDPDDFNLRVELAEIFMEAQNPASALPHLQKAAALKPENQEAQYNLGVLYYELDRYAESAQSFEQALTLGEDYSAMFNLGILYSRHLGKKEQGRELFKRVATSSAAPDLRERAKAVLDAEN